PPTSSRLAPARTLSSPARTRSPYLGYRGGPRLRRGTPKVGGYGGPFRGPPFPQFNLNPNIFAAFSAVILLTTSFGGPPKMRARNSRDFGQVDSACGKSLPHSMLSTPIVSRSLMPRSSSMNSTNMLRRQ